MSSGVVNRIATVRVLVLLTLLSVLFPAVLFPAAGIGDSKPLDLYFSYSPDQVYEYLDGLGAKGRIAYARMELTTDILFPIVYSLALVVALAMAVRSAFPPGSRFRYLRYLPLPVVISDWCENLSLVVVIHTFPDQRDAVVITASLFTSLKWIFLALVAMTLAATGVLAVGKHFRDW